MRILLFAVLLTGSSFAEDKVEVKAIELPGSNTEYKECQKRQVSALSKQKELMKYQQMMQFAHVEVHHPVLGDVRKEKRIKGGGIPYDGLVKDELIRLVVKTDGTKVLVVNPLFGTEGPIRGCSLTIGKSRFYKYLDKFDEVRTAREKEKQAKQQEAAQPLNDVDEEASGNAEVAK